MDLGDVERLREELAAFVGEMFGSLSRVDQRRQGDCYVRGLMVDGRRKSIVPMAERLPDGNAQALQQFVVDSPWDHQRVLRRVAERMCAAIDPRVWVVDDTSFPKCGRASVGVARQYCGALGQRANCQVGVSVHAATDAMSCPLQWRLFLPEEWAQDPARRARAGVPDDVGHVEKWRLALDAIDTLAGWGLAPPVVVADAGYGQIGEFRHELGARGLDFVVAVRGDEIAHAGDAVPSTIAYSGLGPRPLPRYRQRARSLVKHAVAAGRGRSSRSCGGRARAARCARDSPRPRCDRRERSRRGSPGPPRGMPTSPGTGCCRCSPCSPSGRPRPRSRPTTG
ncbi:IS701 family transposase [Embleya hyalina]|uniref:IS701 family transposase n=1 Tax=Embleya hyalina TaxID=516124 RepID=UPI003FCEAF1D